MNFVNHTPFPAQDFACIDQYDQEFYVIALRQTLEWGDDAELEYASQQEPLCESDVYWALPHTSGVRQESDYCHYKPKCDVIVHATAYAPEGIPSSSYLVRLHVRLPDTPPVSPPRPQGLNQFMEPSPEALQRWEASIPTAPVRGETLIEKTLRVCGPREFKRRAALTRATAGLVRIATLGTVRFTPWKLTKPTPVASVPLRPEFGFGGECRITAGTPAADRVAAKHRLTDGQAVLRAAGRALRTGFAQPWFVNATGARSVAAPQIEHHKMPISVRDFLVCLNGRKTDGVAAKARQGFGVRAKSHPDRQRLAGTVDDQFTKSERWLPEDFSFAVWNTAEPDQQTQFLNGGELIELINMCPAGTPGTRSDTRGNTVLTLALPKNECYILIRLDSGEFFPPRNGNRHCDRRARRTSDGTGMAHSIGKGRRGPTARGRGQELDPCGA